MAQFARHVALVVLILALAIPWHEAIGHALVGISCGGTVTSFRLFGVQFVPDLQWVGLAGGRGACKLTGISSEWCMHLADLAGSISNFIPGAIAAFALWHYKPRGLKRTALTALSLWCTDLLTAMLPSFGVRRYIWSGSSNSEPYQAAVAMGIPGPLFQAMVIIALCAVFYFLVSGIARRPKTRTAAA